ncbi:MAG TPA: hypothetical protein VM327_09720 [Candidatus Thermoplasmatota archaeon]|nr:hypothetical protein [Candidatus Thermoplasmatota archaeon]
MAVPWGLLAFVIGLLYGALKRGRQDKSDLFKRGLLIGLVVGIVLALIGFLTGYPILGVGGFLAAIWGAFVLTLLFILGVWIGDLVTGAKRH